MLWKYLWSNVDWKKTLRNAIMWQLKAYYTRDVDFVKYLGRPDKDQVLSGR
jgi:hypothetical protein